MHIGNLLKMLPDSLPCELFEDILSTDRLRIERILSRGQSTPQGEWYDQNEHEWVLLVEGGAVLSIEDPQSGEARLLRLGPGDYLNLPAHQRHRVESTAPDRTTIWLAIFY
ncbi:phosphoribosylaminoimidazole carboxylase [Aeromonas schubertii]|uniref:Phosphoribosylaminoimidazole carboxylase n=1 Tax=Aeromonas schubertii TaxID=652 RepID=A0A0S2SGB2_9GAMM|nr:phosphoribosylaminoimidazole carboxylase [Aeromonas schubertii]ALP40650.1 hypothetical protein WL1483_1231 [Aeromonas schubertii]